MRVNSFSPKPTIVSARSNGRRSYIWPPAKWQGWQRVSKIGRISVEKLTRWEATGLGTAAGAAEAGCSELIGRGYPQATAATALRASRPVHRKRAFMPIILSLPGAPVERTGRRKWRSPLIEAPLLSNELSNES